SILESNRVEILAGFSKSDEEQKYEKTHEDSLRKIPNRNNPNLTQFGMHCVF
ncbi:unnamed protein product, partial [Prunus brigantina]